nr:MAG TPA: hypothetical protein [Caudoviricetes sp.]
MARRIKYHLKISASSFRGVFYKTERQYRNL